MTRAQRELAAAVRAYLEWCFAHETPPRVEELARTVGMSRSAFTRRFKRICGEPPGRALKRGQLTRVRTLLREGATVNRAAYQAGFGSRTTVYRAFQRLLNTTPKAFTRSR